MEASVKSAAFVDPKTKRLVIHIVNVTEQPAEFELRIKRFGDTSLETVRTTGDLSDQKGDPILIRRGRCRGKLQPRENADAANRG